MMGSRGGLLGLGSEYDGVRRGGCTNWSLFLLNQDLCTVEGDTMGFGHTDGVGYGQSDFKAILGYDRFVCLCLLSRLLDFLFMGFVLCSARRAREECEARASWNVIILLLTFLVLHAMCFYPPCVCYHAIVSSCEHTVTHTGTSVC